ncbi:MULTISPECIES: ferredoxin [Nocardia]|uniref:ferredoxin n=1 Tax=Nocardia TaxID=1817 RepID=UPI0007EAEC74|nr:MULTISPECIES: ferredoxin [Nocardia]MBF6278359.1 ferredoxin [Nocardia nova]OBA41017.1 ferredoxin [Nocardia sp. 852002-51101_SCH5132738]OBB52956.1 ferredoxin [Nocardia sp. 852002-51244_SCH5132740]OBF68464.1 ferredoxin [Mycobacterium sp. 852002-51759_SCH5129042]
MKISVDRRICASLGMCEAVAPDHFEVGSDGTLHVLAPEPPECHRALIEEAVSACPTGALSVEE